MARKFTGKTTERHTGKNRAYQNRRLRNIHKMQCLGTGMLICCGSTATTFASRSLAFSPSSTPTSAPSSVCSTRTRSTLLLTSDPASPVPSAADSPSTRPPSRRRSSARRRSTSPSGSTPSRYVSYCITPCGTKTPQSFKHFQFWPVESLMRSFYRPK